MSGEQAQDDDEGPFAMTFVDVTAFARSEFQAFLDQAQEIRRD
ncbi:hypothetical protein [Thiorhodovibrio winogradskyi]|nr:hypothetical protein [Thiorhodovibrio winogradskyi]